MGAAEEIATADSIFPDALQAAQGLSEGGSTGFGREIDLEVGALALNQAITGQGGTIQDIIADIQNEQIPDLQAKRQEQLQIASSGGELTAGQAFATAILQIAPILIGAAAGGAQGGAIGAEAGLLGATTALKGFSQEQQQQQALAEQ